MRGVPKPSRRALIVLVSTVFVVAFVIVWTLVARAQAWRQEEAVATGPLAAIAVSRDPSLATERDADSDGLLDWEESLRGTDPQKTDTDGDGTEDGDEVASGRDPKVAGPNDNVSDLFASSSAAISAEYDALRRPGTLTDDLAETFAQSFVGAQASGGELSQADQEALVASLAGNVTSASNLPDRYSPSSVSTDANLSLSAYATWFVQLHGDTFTAMGTIKDSPNSPTLVGQAFVDLGRKICAAPTVPALAANISEVCNVNDQIGQGMLSFAAGEQDPVRGIAGVATMRAAEARRGQAYLAVAVYLQDNGISLKDAKYPGFWGAVTQ